jgi:hypothetical protein
MHTDKSILLNPRLSALIGGPNYFTASYGRGTGAKALTPAVIIGTTEVVP